MGRALAGGVLAAGSFGDGRSGSLAGPMGLLLILALAAGTIFLVRNMNARLRRLPDRFPADRPDVPAAPGTGDPPPTRHQSGEVDLFARGERPVVRDDST